MQASQFDFAHSQYTLQETDNDVLFVETPITDHSKAALEEKVHNEATKILDLSRSLFSTVQKKIHTAERAHTHPNLAEFPTIAKLLKLKMMAEAYVTYIDEHSTPELEKTKESLLRARSYLQVSIDQIEKKALSVRREAQEAAAPSSLSLSGLFQMTRSAISTIFKCGAPRTKKSAERATPPPEPPPSFSILRPVPIEPQEAMDKSGKGSGGGSCTRGTCGSYRKRTRSTSCSSKR